MAAPDYVPVARGDEPRRSLPIPPARSWMADRPGDLNAAQPRGPSLGSPGPDQGYALFLAERFVDRLRLVPPEEAADAVAAAAAIGLRRASLYGRAPVNGDIELAFGLLGYLDDAPPDLVEWRRRSAAGAAHHYWVQRALVDRIPESTLRMKPEEVRSRLSEWRTVVDL